MATAEIIRDSNGRFIKGMPSLNKGRKYRCKSYNLSEEGRKQKIKNLGNGMLGKKHSEGWKELMSKKMKGSIISEEQRIKISETNKRKKLSPPIEFWFKKEVRNNILGEFKKGERPWNYTGATPLNELLRHGAKWQIWRNIVFLRDNFTCQNPNCKFCNNKVGVKLHPHHIKPLALYTDLVYDINNGITYCAEFHLKSKLHREIQKTLRIGGQ